jgi:hypothetical protein
LDSVIDKLQKLLNHERSARSIGNLYEAEAFAAKIADMLFAHKLSMSEVEIAKEEGEEPVSQESVDGLTAPWAGVLAMGVCSASFCKVLKSHSGYVFVGRPTDRMVAISMFRHLTTLGKSICDSEIVAYMQSDLYTYESAFKPGIARTWRVSFLRGYANALHSRLAQERKTLTAQAQLAGTSLVYIDRSERAIADYMQEKYGRIGKGRASSTRVHSGAYGAGREAGSRVNIKSHLALRDGKASES